MTEHMVVLTTRNERDGQWLTVPALSTPEDIVHIALRLMGNQAASPGWPEFGSQKGVPHSK
jgi:hypothetical protein